MDPIPQGKGQFLGDMSLTIVKYREQIWSAAERRLMRSKCHFGYVLGWAQGNMLGGGLGPHMGMGNFGGLFCPIGNAL